jgi:hypothetical protein
MSGHHRQGIDSTAFDSLLTMSNPTIKLVLILKNNQYFGQPKIQIFRRSNYSGYRLCHRARN